jgi:uncharacterized protein (DUF433 family)
MSLRTSIALLAERGVMTIQTLERIYGYTESVLSRKPIRKIGEELRGFPTYTIPEAATFLGISPRTMRDWFSGSAAILTASGHIKELPLLSFKDMVEAYALFLLRSEHDFSMQSLRRVLKNLKKHTRAKRPLISEHLRVFRDDLLLERPARAGRERQLVNLSRDGQLALPDIVDVFAKRVLRNSSGKTVAIFPWRLWIEDQESKPVQINPEVMSGRLVVTGTRIPVSILAARRKTESAEEIARDYNLPVESVTKALIHVEKAA